MNSFTVRDSEAGAIQGSALTVLTPADGRGADVAALIADQAAAAGMKVTDPVAVGDTVTAQLPGGKKTFEILEANFPWPETS